MLPPAPRKRAAEATATNAMSSVYSMRSWPCSSFQKLRKKVIFLTPIFLIGSDRPITGCCFRDLAVTACSAGLCHDGNRCAVRPLRGPEHHRDPVVVNNGPVARFLE